MAVQKLPENKRRTKLMGEGIRRKKRIKKSWIVRNLKWITIIFVFLFLIQSFRGCLKNTTYTRSEKSLIKERDSIYQMKDKKIQDLENIYDDSQDEIQRLIYELKIAGVKADEAEKRAKAIQSTAEKIKQNTTITIEADTTRNKIK